MLCAVSRFSFFKENGKEREKAVSKREVERRKQGRCGFLKKNEKGMTEQEGNSLFKKRRAAMRKWDIMSKMNP